MRFPAKGRSPTLRGLTRFFGEQRHQVFPGDLAVDLRACAKHQVTREEIATCVPNVRARLEIKLEISIDRIQSSDYNVESKEVKAF
jgi:hypothetical protein